MVESDLLQMGIQLTKKHIIMAYKWKPNAAQRREYAAKMNDPIERAAIEKKREEKAIKRRYKSSFDYQSAGGNYVPTLMQNNEAAKFMGGDISDEQKNACSIVMYGYSCNEKVNHDFIHIVNELSRSISTVKTV